MISVFIHNFQFIFHNYYSSQSWERCTYLFYTDCKNQKPFAKDRRAISENVGSSTSGTIQLFVKLATQGRQNCRDQACCRIWRDPLTNVQEQHQKNFLPSLALGSLWTGDSLSRLLRNPSLCGLRRYQGETTTDNAGPNSKPLGCTRLEGKRTISQR